MGYRADGAVLCAETWSGAATMIVATSMLVVLTRCLHKSARTSDARRRGLHSIAFSPRMIQTTGCVCRNSCQSENGQETSWESARDVPSHFAGTTPELGDSGIEPHRWRRRASGHPLQRMNRVSTDAPLPAVGTYRGDRCRQRQFGRSTPHLVRRGNLSSRRHVEPPNDLAARVDDVIVMVEITKCAVAKHQILSFRSMRAGSDRKGGFAAGQSLRALSLAAGVRHDGEERGHERRRGPRWYGPADCDGPQFYSPHSDHHGESHASHCHHGDSLIGAE
jgi:hypothetical protein